jgi:hypothetical protein
VLAFVCTVVVLSAPKTLCDPNDPGAYEPAGDMDIGGTIKGEAAETAKRFSVGTNEGCEKDVCIGGPCMKGYGC